MRLKLRSTGRNSVGRSKYQASGVLEISTMNNNLDRPILCGILNQLDKDIL